MGVAVLVPIAVAVVLWVGVAAFGGVVIADDDGGVVVVGQVLLLVVAVFRLLELILLRGVQTQVLGQIPVVSSAEVLAAA